MEDLYKNMRPKRTLIIAGLGILLLIFSFFLDQPVKDFMESVKTPYLDYPLNWVTQFTSVVVVLLIMTSLFLVQGRKKEHILPLWAAFIVAVGLTFILKFLIARPRPDGLEMFYPLIHLLDYSMPSIHAAASFSVLPILDRQFPNVKPFWIFFAIAVAISRVYTGVHYLSDVIGGAVLGYGIGIFFVFLEEKENTSLNVFEIKRKIFHMLGGFLLILLVYFDILTVIGIIALILLVLIISIVSKRYRLPVIHLVIEQIEREKYRQTFPGKGAVFFLGGFLFTLLLFPKDIAIASMVVLTVGDGISALVGMRYGNIKHPLSSEKFIEGHAAGALAAFFALISLSVFGVIQVKWIEALLASFIAMFVEGIDLKWNLDVVDDNITVPVTAGLVIWLVRALF